MTDLIPGHFIRNLPPWAAAVFAALLVVLGLLLAFQTEREYRDQGLRQTEVQARIIAASVAPALMFDDPAAADEYLEALVANPVLRSASVYDTRGVRLAWFGRAEEPPARIDPALIASTFSGDVIDVTVPVERDGERFGLVTVRGVTESVEQRLMRYAGVAVLIALAALLITVFGLAQASLRRANAELAARAVELQAEMDQRKKAEEELLQSRKLEAMGQLTGGVAHDFNNLLQVLNGGLSMLTRKPDESRANRIMLGMQQAVDRGANLTRQLLAFARRQTLELQTVDIGQLLEGMRELLDRSLRADILVETIIPSGLWHARTDRSQLELAILNTAVNARDAMPSGGVLRISCNNTEVEGQRWVEIVVSDTGSGMPPEVAERVFEPFFTTKGPGQGTGLGLSQVYGIAKQSGGDVHIDSTVNVGTSITVRLPAAAPVATIERSGGEASAPDAAPLADMAILVVEDDDSVAASVVEMLNDLGCRVKRARDAQAGLAEFRGVERFDLVFSDILMPGDLNGLDLAREIRRLSPAQSIILTTGYSGIAKADEIDFPLLRKPYSLDALRAMLLEARRKWLSDP